MFSSHFDIPKSLTFQTSTLPWFSSVNHLANNNMTDMQLLILELGPIHGPYSDYRRNTTYQENQLL
jgi:hypothetical protein